MTMHAPAARYLILDRDGVINRDSEHYIKCPEEWEPIPGSLEAIARLRRRGFRIVVITNQSGLARGLFDRKTLDRIHARMHRMVEAQGGKIDAVFFCPHSPDDGCGCRKPRPGMFQAFARESQVPLKDLPVVGDALSDIEAALAVGARPLLVRTGKGTQTLQRNPQLDIPCFRDLYDAAEHILAQS